MFLYIPTTLVATLRWKAVSRDQVDHSWQVLGNIEFGWKKAGKVTFKVGQEWRMVGQGNSRSRPIRFRVSPCTAFNKPSFEKSRVRMGRQVVELPRVRSKGQHKGGRLAEDSPRAVDDLLLKLLTQRRLLLYSSWSSCCPCHVKSGFPTHPAESEQVLESPLCGWNIGAQHRNNTEILWENDAKLGHPLLFLKLGFILLVCSSGRM